MKDSIKTSLDAMFERNTASMGAAAEFKRNKENAENDFIADFVEARNRFIYPAMVEIGQYIKGKGYGFEISQDDDQSPKDGRGSSAASSITFTLFMGPRSYRKDEHPCLKVICDKHQQIVRFHECTHSTHPGGHSRAAGEEKLPAVTRELIQEKITDLISQVFRRDASSR
jgi:hypothetical protein